jgi:hypothetical protein
LGDWNKSLDKEVDFTEGRLGLSLDLPKGNFVAEWWDTRKCVSLRRTNFNHRGGPSTLSNPPFQQDIALSVRRR